MLFEFWKSIAKENWKVSSCQTYSQLVEKDLLRSEIVSKDKQSEIIHSLADFAMVCYYHTQTENRSVNLHILLLGIGNVRSGFKTIGICSSNWYLFAWKFSQHCMQWFSLASKSQRETSNLRIRSKICEQGTRVWFPTCFEIFSFFNVRTIKDLFGNDLSVQASSCYNLLALIDKKRGNYGSAANLYER
jgi:hypothetical protein